MSKFVCNSCEKAHEIKNYTIGIINGETIYFNKGSKVRLCCDCDEKTPLCVVDEKVDLSSISFNRFSSMSILERQKLLKKRSHKHFEKEIKEKKHEMGKETIKHLLNR